MSLVPYSSRDSREIVLRHDDAIVIRDPQTQQLILRGANASSHCPTCHRPLRSSSTERQSSPHRAGPFISPEYFRMLRSANGRSEEEIPPPSPIRRLMEPASISVENSTGGSLSDVEFVSRTPATRPGHAIKKEAFSPNYFERFFIEENELGRGGKGVVLLVRHELDGVSLGQFACKRVPVGDDHTWLEKVLIEVQLLQGLSHPNLVSYRHVWLEDVKLNRFGPSVPCAFILQQYCNSGDLLHYIVGPAVKAKSAKEKMKEQKRRRSRGQSEMPNVGFRQRRLAFEEIYSFFKDITSGLAHLHASNYIHRDLKPSNCLLHQDGNEMRCLISDFGEVQAENVVRKSTGSTGTISYCAPEVLRQDSTGRYGNFTTKSDIFSLGMILYFMCFGRLPYKSADSIQEEYEDITLLRAEISSWSGFREERRERSDLPNQLYDFLRRLLAIDPADRPGASDILTAIRTEKGLEKPSRSRNGSNGSLSGRILLESHIPPGPAVNDSPKRVRTETYNEDASTPKNTSPENASSTQLIIENPHSRARSASRSRVNHNRATSTYHPKMITPLLMPPPTTPFSFISNKISFYNHHLYLYIRRNLRSPGLGIKLFVFILKLWSLVTPCKPRVVRDMLLWPLVVMAALELAMGRTGGWDVLAWAALLHFAILGAGVFWSGSVEGLCWWDGRLSREWDWE